MRRRKEGRNNGRMEEDKEKRKKEGMNEGNK